MFRLEFDDEVELDDLERIERTLDVRLPRPLLAKWLSSSVFSVCTVWIRLMDGFGEDHRVLAGYVVWRDFQGVRAIRYVAVARHIHGGRIGRALIEFAETDGIPLEIEVPEGLVGVQLWLRACGMKCIRQHKKASEPDVYFFARERAAVGVSTTRGR